MPGDPIPSFRLSLAVVKNIHTIGLQRVIRSGNRRLSVAPTSGRIGDAYQPHCGCGALPVTYRSPGVDTAPVGLMAFGQPFAGGAGC
jgi:hypothetical protein